MVGSSQSTNLEGDTGTKPQEHPDAEMIEHCRLLANVLNSFQPVDSRATSSNALYVHTDPNPVMLADDQIVVREGLKKILSLDPEIQVVS